MASEEKGGNLIIAEQTLVNPAFQCYVLLDSENETHNKIKAKILSYSSEFIPYLGKNDCSVWWENAEELRFEFYTPNDSFTINSLFVKEKKIKGGEIEQMFSLHNPTNSPEQSKLPYMYFERLPISYIGAPLFQYDYKNFAFTNATLKAEYRPTSDLPLLKLENGDIIQVF
jgi:CRISPR-associated protein Cas5h